MQPVTEPSYAAKPELALSALLHLLSRFPARRSVAVALSIVDHLRIIEADGTLPESLRATARTLLPDWEDYATLAGDSAGHRPDACH
nr:hypothetical protein [Zoogloeaceae bacterium]